jgi:predicted amidophosphoribosyltransferase
MCRALAAFGGHTLALQAVARIRPTRRQIGLSRAGRKRNLRGAFAVPVAQRHKVKGRAVVIVDDVLTTGATVEAMARILRQAGAGPIYVVTAARVVLPERA